MNNTINDARVLAIHNLFHALVTLTALGLTDESLTLLTDYRNHLTMDGDDEEKIIEVIDLVIKSFRDYVDLY